MIWDPTLNTWHDGPKMKYGRQNMGLATMKDGRIIAAGGYVYAPNGTSYNALSKTVDMSIY